MSSGDASRGKKPCSDDLEIGFFRHQHAKSWTAKRNDHPEARPPIGRTQRAAKPLGELSPLLLELAPEGIEPLFRWPQRRPLQVASLVHKSGERETREPAHDGSADAK